MLHTPSLGFAGCVRGKRAVDKHVGNFFKKGMGGKPVMLLTPGRGVVTAAAASRGKRFVIGASFESDAAFLVRTHAGENFTKISVRVRGPRCPITFRGSPFHSKTTAFVRSCLLGAHSRCCVRNNVEICGLGRMLVAKGQGGPDSADVCAKKVGACAIRKRRLRGCNTRATFSTMVELPKIDMVGKGRVRVHGGPRRPIVIVSSMICRSSGRVLAALRTDSVSDLDLLHKTSTTVLNSHNTTNTVIVALGSKESLPTEPTRKVVACSPLKCDSSIRFCRPACSAPRGGSTQHSSLEDAVC